MENLDLKAQLDESTPLVIGVVLVLGFLLLLIALQAPLISLLGTLASLLSTAAAFGVARLIFQEGHRRRPARLRVQGFLDAWAPVFFFAMIFAIAMDYTVFLLASAKEHYERSGDPKDAMVGSLAHSGRVIFAAGAVMVAVFFTFALSGPIPPKEMGVVLGLAVLLDAFLVRLVLLARDAPPHRTGRLVHPGLAAKGPAEHHLRPRLTQRLARHHRASSHAELVALGVELHDVVEVLAVGLSHRRPAAGPDRSAQNLHESSPLPGQPRSYAACMSSRRILVVEDEPLINQAVSERLESEGYDVVRAFDGPGAVSAFAEHCTGPGAARRDAPGFDGHEVCRRIQAERPVPVLMLTARDDEADILVGLGVGADDYLTKPFRMRELVARVAALLRRVDRAGELASRRPTEIGGLRIDPASRRVWRDEVEVRLTPTEFDLLACLAAEPGTVVTRERLLADVWGWPGGSGTRTVDSHVKGLRAKIGADRVRTVHGVGYSLEPGDE